MVRGKGIRRDKRKITRHTRLGNARGGENKEKGKSKRKHSSGKKKMGGMGNNRKKRNRNNAYENNGKKGGNEKMSAKCDNNIQHGKI